MNRFFKPVILSISLLAFGWFIHHEYFCSTAQASCSAQTTPPQNFSSQQITQNYFKYSDTGLETALAMKKRVILYFYAPWCATCSSFDQELLSSSNQLPEDVIVFQIPYDTATQLKNQYKVTYQHTLILLNAKGETQEMWIGGDLESLLEYLPGK